MDIVSHKINTIPLSSDSYYKRCDFCNKEVDDYYPHYDGKACSRTCANKLIDLKGGKRIGYRLEVKPRRKGRR